MAGKERRGGEGEDGAGSGVGRARCGMGHVQMRKIKRGVCEYDYVEVMACPSACLNGGGQLPLPKKARSAAEVMILIRPARPGLVCLAQ